MQEFDSYEYFKPRIEELGIAGIYRASGIANIEEMLSQISQLKSTVLIVKDGKSGFLKLQPSNFDTNYNSLFILKHVPINDSKARREAKAICLKIGKLLFLKMSNDYEFLENDNLRIDFERIGYDEIGPLAQNFHGYSFSFTIQEDFYIE